MATKMDITKFDNIASEALADLIGELDCEAKAIEARLADAKAELKHRGLERADGERFSVTRVDATRWTLDTAKVKAEMGEAWATARSKIASVTSFRVSINRAALAA